jgi:hypothetical protein
VVSPSPSDRSLSQVNGINPLVSLHDIHGRKRGGLFFYPAHHTRRDTQVTILINSFYGCLCIHLVFYPFSWFLRFLTCQLLDTCRQPYFMVVVNCGLRIKSTQNWEKLRWAYHLTSAVFLIAKSFWYSLNYTGSRRNIWDVTTSTE